MGTDIKLRHRDMVANEHIRIDSNSFEKVKTFKYLGSLVTNQKFFSGWKNVELKQEIYVIIHSKHFVFSTSL